MSGRDVANTMKKRFVQVELLVELYADDDEDLDLIVQSSLAHPLPHTTKTTFISSRELTEWDAKSIGSGQSSTKRKTAIPSLSLPKLLAHNTKRILLAVNRRGREFHFWK